MFAVINLFTGLVFFSTLSTKTAQFALWMNVALFVVEIGWEFLGDYAVRHESNLAMYTWWTLSLFLPAFLINIVADYFTDNQLFQDANDDSVLATMCVFVALTLANRLLTVGCSILLYRAFGVRYAGLRRILKGGNAIQKFDRQRVAARQRTTREPSTSALAAAGGGGTAGSLGTHRSHFSVGGGGEREGDSGEEVTIGSRKVIANPLAARGMGGGNLYPGGGGEDDYDRDTDNGMGTGTGTGESDWEEEPYEESTVVELELTPQVHGGNAHHLGNPFGREESSGRVLNPTRDRDLATGDSSEQQAGSNTGKTLYHTREARVAAAATLQNPFRQ